MAFTGPAVFPFNNGMPPSFVEPSNGNMTEGYQRKKRPNPNDTLVLSTAPEDPPTHWQQVLYKYFPPKKTLGALSILLFAFHAPECKVGLKKSELITINNLQPILVADFIKSTLGELDKYIIHCTCHRWTCKYIPRPFEICLL